MENKTEPGLLAKEIQDSLPLTPENNPLASLHPGDAAEVLREVPKNQRAEVLRDLDPEHAAGILEKLPDDMAAAAIMDMAPLDASVIVQEMTTDEQADLLQDVSSDHAEAILGHIEKADAVEARKLIAFPEDTAGGLMQREFIAISSKMTTGEVIRLLQSKSEEYADYPATYLYVVEENERLRGVVSMRDLVLNSLATDISRITKTDVVSVPASMPGKDLVRVFHRYHYYGVPVVDDEGRFLGIVMEEDAMRFAEEEADEELLRFSGIVMGDEFRDMPLFSRLWRRLSWLSINIILNLIAASVIAFHQETVRAVVALAVFLPIISDMSGCSGNQAVAVSIRELSLDRIRPRDYLRVLAKEASIGLVNGLVLGMIIGGVALVWKGNAVLGAIVGAALWVNTIVAVTMGGVIPLLLRTFRQDPAIASSPILTTMTDMCGFFVLLALASKYIHLLS